MQDSEAEHKLGSFTQAGRLCCSQTYIAHKALRKDASAPETTMVVAIWSTDEDMWSSPTATPHVYS